VRRLLAGALVATSCTCGAVLGAAAPALADGSSCVGLNDPETEGVEPATEPGASFEELQIAQAQALVEGRTGLAAGSGVTVALIESGVPSSLRASENADLAPLGEDGYEWWSGPAMAGLIGGPASGDVPVGFAPGVTLRSIRAFDVGVGGSGDDVEPPRVSSLVAALAKVPSDADVVVVPQTVVPSTDEERRDLQRAVKRLTRKGVVVVAAAGDRPVEGQPGYGAAGEADPGEDHADLFWPAALAQADPRVLAVTSTAAADGSLAQVLPSSAVSVAVPTAGAVSYALTGDTCQIPDISSATAAAEVAGIVAMLMSYFEDETPDQVVARLLHTATGAANAELPDPRVGAGVVQPVEALTRPLRPAKDGTIAGDAPPRASTPPAVVPEPEADRLASTRDDLVRWGLIGGLALVLVLVLRPVFTRHRNRPGG